MFDHETSANILFDKQHGDPYEYNRQRMKSGWNAARLAMGKPLTDRKIARYAKLGYYSSEYREKRKLYQQKKNGQAARQGNFDIIEGRLVYRPD